MGILEKKKTFHTTSWVLLLGQRVIFVSYIASINLTLPQVLHYIRTLVDSHWYKVGIASCYTRLV